VNRPVLFDALNRCYYPILALKGLCLDVKALPIREAGLFLSAPTSRMSIVEPTRASAWSPLREPLFRTLWIASVASNIGTWMQNVGAAWLMTSLAPSPTMVALVQAATSLPVFLVGLPAGAVADLVDRRRLLLITQGWMLAAAGALGLLTFFDMTTSWLLLILTFALGLGAAMNAPAWQAIIPELVDSSELRAAVTLNGVGFNVARAVGPALGGLIVAALGSAAVFVLNALSFLGVMIVLYRWRRPEAVSVLPAEDVLSAMRSGMRYVRHAPALRAVLLRTGIFIFGGSALWALLPLVTRQELALDATGYGILLGCLGTGAVVGAFLLPRIEHKLSTDTLLTSAIVLFAFATAGPAYARHFGLLCVVMVVGGVAWITIMSTFNVGAQVTVPAWVRARALAVYGLVFQGGTAIGSAFWGSLAERLTLSMALVCAGAILVLGLVAMLRYRLKLEEEINLAPSLHWPEPALSMIPPPDAGPVLVTVEYSVDPGRARDFVSAMDGVRELRLRDGAYRWGLYNDQARPTRFVETFVVESWAEHLRQHERVTVADRKIEDVARAFHIGETPPTVAHLIHARYPASKK
jgi:MFS family permease